MSKTKIIISKTCLAALFLALGYVLPFLTGNIPEIGSMLCPMHIPVLLAGFILGPYYGLLIGLILPITRSLMFSMPPIFPTATAMSFELATYGFVSGLVYRLFLNKVKLNQIASCIISLLIAMIVGRAVLGLVNILLYAIQGNSYTIKLFLSGAFVKAWPGIILQIILIPVLMTALMESGSIRKYVNE